MTLDFNGNLNATGTVTSNSDIKLKDNINTIENALEKVNQLRGVSFTRNDHEDKEKLHIGVIAQEVEQIIPEVVITNNEIKSVAYGNLVGILIEAVKELKGEINTLKNIINNHIDQDV